MLEQGALEGGKIFGGIFDFFLDICSSFAIMILALACGPPHQQASQIAGLCKGSTADSDSVCEGSNPSPAARKPGQELFRRLLTWFCVPAFLVCLAVCIAGKHGSINQHTRQMMLSQWCCH